jgi:hypothetical protein
MKGSQQKRQESDGGDQNYENDAIEPEDDGLDEVERIRKAMAKEKIKAQEFAEKKIVRKVELAPSTNKFS